MNHPTPTPKPFNGFKYIVIPILGLLSASVFAFGIFSDDEGKLNLPWQTTVSTIPTLASTDTYGCPYALEKGKNAQLEHTSLVATPRQETYLSFDISAANEGKHYDITLISAKA
jgi:hypothetical protein